MPEAVHEVICQVSWEWSLEACVSMKVKSTEVQDGSA